MQLRATAQTNSYFMTEKSKNVASDAPKADREECYNKAWNSTVM